MKKRCRKCSSARKFPALTDKTPKYTVKEFAELAGMSTYAIRYYENEGLIPEVQRTYGNIRMFSDYNLSWLRLVHCLRATGLSIENIKHYIEMCFVGDQTIPARAEIIFQQEKSLREQIKTLAEQMKIIQYKKQYYQKLLVSKKGDVYNPANFLTNRSVKQHARRHRDV